MDTSELLTRDRQQTLLEGLREMTDIFWGPSPDKCAALLAGSFFDLFEKMDSLAGLGISKALREVRSNVKLFSDADALYHHLEEAYVRLFISDQNGIAAPLYESCYTGPKSEEIAPLMGEAAIRMKKRFESKGLAISKDVPEPPDHLAIELEYLYFLLEKGWSDGERALIGEAPVFASETLLPWLSRFQSRLGNETEDRFYATITSILKAMLRFIAGLK